jgi:hypothetical protein
MMTRGGEIEEVFLMATTTVAPLPRPFVFCGLIEAVFSELRSWDGVSGGKLRFFKV